MPEGEARRRFAAARVAVLGTVGDGGRPHLVPVVFAAAGDTVVTVVDRKPKRTERLARLRHIEADPAVALLAQAYGEDWERLWWVRADGRARILDTGPGFREALGLLARKYPQYRTEPPGGPVVTIAVERWTGWRASD